MTEADMNHDELIELLRQAAPRAGPDLTARLVRSALDELDRMRVLRLARFASLAASAAAAAVFAWIYLAPPWAAKVPAGPASGIAVAEFEIQETLFLHEDDARTDEAMLLVDADSSPEELIVGYLADGWREEP